MMDLEDVSPGIHYVLPSDAHSISLVAAPGSTERARREIAALSPLGRKIMYAYVEDLACLIRDVNTEVAKNEAAQP